MKIWMGKLLAGLALLAATGAAWALEAFAETPQETAMCSAYMYGGQDKGFKMRTEGADDWGHMHHYCDCVRYRYRALRAIADKHTYKYNLGVAIGGCDYVLEKASAGFYMRPRILVDKGRAQRMLGSSGPAARSFLEAIQMNPNEVNAYLELAETQRALGQNGQAVDTLYQGLRHNPEVKVLQQRYRELGGKEPFPEPLAKPEPPAPQPEAAPEARPSATSAASGARPEGPQDTPSSPPREPLDQGCRFCPPEAVQKKWEESFKDK